ncbi:hypothetical protein BDN72DRAFT_906928 [Pluteus cervinus]|uniref:Uncharacterized protein n=1 Tax=Pluteus cervinus TaxID=181527 RepID=A0ACD2ZXT5_9AGAR|nr:hypothetical protein BDN72DRAFT_906928 [Pluteus cervinus]
MRVVHLRPLATTTDPTAAPETTAAGLNTPSTIPSATVPAHLAHDAATPPLSSTLFPIHTSNLAVAAAPASASPGAVSTTRFSQHSMTPAPATTTNPLAQQMNFPNVGVRPQSASGRPSTNYPLTPVDPSFSASGQAPSSLSHGRSSPTSDAGYTIESDQRETQVLEIVDSDSDSNAQRQGITTSIDDDQSGDMGDDDGYEQGDADGESDPQGEHEQDMLEEYASSSFGSVPQSPS